MLVESDSAFVLVLGIMKYIMKKRQTTFKDMFFAKLTVIFFVFITLVGLVFFVNQSAATAQATDPPVPEELDKDGFDSRLTGDPGVAAEEAASKESCGGVAIAFKVGCREDFSNPILAYLVAVLRFLTYGVGMVVTLMIVIGGIQYSVAGGNAQSVTAAKTRIINAFLALVLYIFAFAILNFVVPGGLIG